MLKLFEEYVLKDEHMAFDIAKCLVGASTSLARSLAEKNGLQALASKISQLIENPLGESGEPDEPPCKKRLDS